MVAAALATPGLRCVGVEYDAEYAGRARAAVAEAGLADRVTVLHANVLDVPFLADATCCFIYLVPKGMKLIADDLCTLVARGGRVVSYVFAVPGAWGFYDTPLCSAPHGHFSQRFFLNNNKKVRAFVGAPLTRTVQFYAYHPCHTPGRAYSRCTTLPSRHAQGH